MDEKQAMKQALKKERRKHDLDVAATDAQKRRVINHSLFEDCRKQWDEGMLVQRIKDNGNRMIETFYNDLVYKNDKSANRKATKNSSDREETQSNLFYRTMINKEFRPRKITDAKSEISLNNLQRVVKREFQDLVNV